MIERGKKSDSFASHYASHFPQGKTVTPGEIREIMNFKVLWQGNPISCTKTFGKLNCSLCMRERIEILRAQQQDEFKIINHNNEIFGTCRHNPKFHSFLKDDLNVRSTSTDEGDKPE